MGLLDDAIREHLDLKRRRGADPAEVARLEQEALGPVRREPAAAEAAAEQHHDAEPAEHPHPVADGRHPDDRTHVLAPEDRHDPPHGDPLLEPHAHASELGGAAAEAPAPQPEPGGDASAAGDAAPTDGGDAPSAGDAAPAAERPAPAPDPALVDQPTTEYRVEDHHDDDREDPAEDVLEETPDFLQETPEHDRLWFEQRPPRDFDFDG